MDLFSFIHFMRWWGQNYLWLESLLVTRGLQMLTASLLWYVRLWSFGSSYSFIPFHDFSSTSFCCVSVVLKTLSPGLNITMWIRQMWKHRQACFQSIHLLGTKPSEILYFRGVWCASGALKMGIKPEAKEIRKPERNWACAVLGRASHAGRWCLTLDGLSCLEKTLETAFECRREWWKDSHGKMIKKQPNELNQQSGFSDVRKKSCKTGILYNKVE